MHRKTLLASALAVLMAGSASFVMAQNAPTTAPAPAAQSTTQDAHHKAHAGEQRGHRMHHGDKRGHNRMARHGFNQHRNGVIADLQSLERLYQQAGRSKDLTALYNDVLSKSQNPQVRGYVYHRLARLQSQPSNVDQAITTLRKGLDESLANDAKMQAMHKEMRSTRQSRQGTAAPAPTQVK